MIEQEIVDYITQAQKHGLSDFEIKQNLLKAGWEATVVEESFVFAKAAESKNSLSPHKDPVKQGSTITDQGHTPSSPTAAPILAMPDPSVNIGDQHFQQTTSAKSTIFKKPIFWVVLIFLIFLGSGAYGYYQYFYNTPEKVLNKYFSTLSKKEPVQATFDLSYSDKNAPGTASSTQEFTIGLNSNGYTDNTDLQNIKAQADLKAFVKSGSEQKSIEFEAISLGKVFYINLANINELKEAFGPTDISWVKFDLDELQKYSNEQLQKTGASSTDSTQLNQELKNKLNTIWNSSNILTPGTIMAKETVDKTAVFRLEPQVNYVNLHKAVTDSIDAIQSYQKYPNLKLSEEDKSNIFAVINKFKAKEFKLWIGQKDYKLYKISVVINAPSVKDLSSSLVENFLPVLNSAQSKNRDAQRLSDVKQIQTALDLYFKNNKGYPEAKDGVPVGLNSLYITKIPTAPLPVDGTCTGYYNTYWYVSKGKPLIQTGVNLYPDYELTYCLGSSTGGYSSGIGKVTPSEIQSGIACPSTPENCANENPAKLNFADALDKMDFNAEISYEVSLKNYGIKKDLKEPENATDALDLFKQAFRPVSQTSQTGIK